MDRETLNQLEQMSKKLPYTRKVLDNCNGDIHDPKNFESDADYSARILMEQGEIMDKEIIKMCDCPEIYKMWEQKKYRSDSSEEKYEAKQITLWFQGHLRTAYDVPPIYFIDCTYIPRIENVLEWLSDRMTQGKVMYEIIRRDEDSCLRGGIRCFMHFVHNKSWSGNAWKKS